jgi:Putative zincin peptidase
VRVYEWQPGRGVLLLWVLLAFPLTLAGMVIFGGVLATRHGGEATVSIGAGELPLLLFALLLLGALHEGAHGLVIRAVGARPCYSAGTYRKLMPYLACTAPGYRFTKREYLAIALAPAVMLSALGVGWTLAGPGAQWLVLPLAFHLAGCIGDFWMAGVTLAAPANARVEDMGTGLRVHADAG